MIICPECGHRNPDGTRFCQCGHFLEWEPEPEPAQVRAQEPAADPIEPAPVAPTPSTRRTAPPPPRETHVPVQRAYDVVCGRCGAGNERDRTLCRSCGRPLEPVGAGRRSWWRRLMDRLRRRRYRANERPKRFDFRMTRRLMWIVAIVGVVLIGLALRPLINRAVFEVRDLVSTPAPIRASGFAASSALGNAPARNLGDGLNNRYWAPQGEAAGAWVEIAFARPVRLREIIITGGVSPDHEQFLKHARPNELEAVATAPDGSTTTKTLTMRDQPGAQTFGFRSRDTVKLRIFVKSTYGPAGTPTVAIGEVELFGRV